MIETQGHWCTGNCFSAADIQLGYPLEAWASGSSGLGKAPSLLAYLERLRQRPAYKEAERKGVSVLL